MKIVNIFGGLGNQMFQYALITALKKKYNEEVLADIHYMNGYDRHNGIELEKIFPIKLELATREDIKRLSFYTATYKRHKYLKWLHIRKPSTIVEILSKPYHGDVFTPKSRYYDGYWQDPQYYSDIRNELSACFTFKNPLSEKNQAALNTICSCPSVGIHIRRGDYLKKGRYRGICDIDYYTKAISLLKKRIQNPHFFLFSNDIEWCTQNIMPIIAGCEQTMIDWNTGSDSYVDMQLMSNCNSLIIANSSFSWWAAYLGRKKDMVIAPKTWFNAKPPLRIQIEEWLLL